MPQSNKLARILDVLLDEETGGELLTNILDLYRDLLLSASGIDLGGEAELGCFHTGAGVAIGTTWAALCIDDALRTKKFVSGAYHAVRAVAARRPGPVHVLYAGTGPWATLMLPLTSRFSPRELRITCIEINDASFAGVRRTIASLGLDDYVEDFVQADAATYRIPKAAAVDILLSETMQYCLIDEMQVPIVLNLLAQLPPDTILIPERINVILGVLDADTERTVTRELGPAFTFDRACTESYQPRADNLDFPTRRVRVPAPEGAAPGPLALLTTIDVYGGNHLTHYESALTHPRVIGDYPDADNRLAAIDFTYHLEPAPVLGMRFLT